MSRLKNSWRRRFLVLAPLAAALGLGLSVARAADPPAKPAVGDKARDFTLTTVEGESVSLAGLRKQGPVVLVVLRGYPGYQCPLCNAQVGQFVASAKKFQAAKASLVFVYPGPGEKLKERAQEFLRGKTLPENVYLVLDPDYGFASAYALRWSAPRETAYPSTFVIDQAGQVQFAQISQTHGGRASADQALAALGGK